MLGTSLGVWGYGLNETKIPPSWSLYSTGEKQNKQANCMLYLNIIYVRKGESSGIRSLMGEEIFVYLNSIVGTSLSKKVIYEQGLDVRVSQTNI